MIPKVKIFTKIFEMQEVVRHGSCPTRKLSDKTQPNDTQNYRTVSLSNTFRVEHFPPSQIFITIDAQHHEECLFTFVLTYFYYGFFKNYLKVNKCYPNILELWNERTIFKALPTRPVLSWAMTRCLNMQKFEQLAFDHLFSKTDFSKYFKTLS